MLSTPLLSVVFSALDVVDKHFVHWFDTVRHVVHHRTRHGVMSARDPSLSLKIDEWSVVERRNWGQAFCKHTGAKDNPEFCSKADHMNPAEGECWRKDAWWLTHVTRRAHASKGEERVRRY